MEFDSKEKLFELAALLREKMSLSPTGQKALVDKTLIQFANTRHRVGPLFYKACAQRNKVAIKNDDLLLLKRLYQTNVQRLLSQKAATKKLTDLLATNNIHAIQLKGTGLATQLHQDAAQRQSRDIDILIKPETSKQVLRLLSTHGYKTAGKHSNSAITTNRFRMSITKDLSVKDPNYGQLIELHQRVMLFDTKNFSADLMVSISGRSIPEIKNSHYVMYLILHGALSFWQRLTWLVDLSILVRKIDKSQRVEIIELSEHYHCQPAIVASLCLVEEIFPGSLDEDWQTIIHADKSNTDVAETTKMFRNSLFGHAPGDIYKAGKKTKFHGPSWHIFRGQMSFLGMLPRRIATLLMSRM